MDRRVSLFVLSVLNSILCGMALGEEAMEEVAVRATLECGPWPISHHLARPLFCEFSTIQKNRIDALNVGRERYLENCLSCSSEACFPIDRKAMTSYEFFSCRTLFLAPVSLKSFIVREQSAESTVVKRSTKDSSASLSVRFRYSINEKGRVEDLVVIELDSDMPEARVARMIERGAKLVKYEPLILNGAAISIRGVIGRIVLR